MLLALDAGGQLAACRIDVVAARPADRRRDGFHLAAAFLFDGAPGGDLDLLADLEFALDEGAADDAAGLAISERLKAQIRSLAQAERNGLPDALRPIHGEIQVLSQLYDEYQSARAQLTHHQQRVNLARKYGERGDELFKGGPINDLWQSMKVWE
jgi:hypothetical protein